MLEVPSCPTFKNVQKSHEQKKLVVQGIWGSILPTLLCGDYKKPFFVGGVFVSLGIILTYGDCNKQL